MGLGPRGMVSPMLVLYGYRAGAPSLPPPHALYPLLSPVSRYSLEFHMEYMHEGRVGEGGLWGRGRAAQGVVGIGGWPRAQ